MSRAACAWLGLMVLVACLGPMLTGDPDLTRADAALLAPGGAHWFGTDQLGRDIFARTVAAARIDLAVAAGAVVISATIGTLIGDGGGLARGWPDAAAGRAVDVLMAFPLFVLALALVAALGNSIRSVVIATAVVNLPFYFRLARAEIRVRRGLGYVDAARAGGAGAGRILTLFLLPPILPLIAVQGSVNLGWAVMNVAGLSFLGLGVRPPQAEWGVMLADGARLAATGAWWPAFFPGLALFLTILAFNLAGDGLRDRIAGRVE